MTNNKALLSQADFLLIAEALAGKKVNFSTHNHSFKGTLHSVHEKEKGVLCINLDSPESRKRFTSDPWVKRAEKCLTISLLEKDKIWQEDKNGRIYISFLNACHMNIG